MTLNWQVVDIQETNLEIDGIPLAEPLFKLRNDHCGMSIKQFKITYAVTRKGRTGDGSMESRRFLMIFDMIK